MFRLNSNEIYAINYIWFDMTGIIESDDIQVITMEVDKCLNFSRKCQMLVDSVKKKYRQRYVSQLHLACFIELEIHILHACQ